VPKGNFSREKITVENSDVVIAVDCLGGDNYPQAQVGGMAIFLQNNPAAKVRFLLYGEKSAIDSSISHYRVTPEKYIVVNTTKRISSEEKPGMALRQGKDSSMWLAIEAVKQGRAVACISAGNTGALMAMSKIILRPLPDVDRPALIQLIPTMDGGRVALLDMGANVDCNARNLYQFALMGSVFYSAVTGKEEPRIGLLNVGSEDLKGNDVIQHTAILLKDSILVNNFHGFVEGNDIFRNVVDVVVTDGFTGNIVLKAIEGTAKFFTTSLKESISSSNLSKLWAWLLSKYLKGFKNRINPVKYNGAMFIGLSGISIKSHGNANEESFYFSIENTLKLVRNDINRKLLDIMAHMPH
jgi:glycerol-3-phosphate acyltransferase PlsX